MKDIEIIYMILARVFNEKSKVEICRKVNELSKKDDEEIERVLNLIKGVRELSEL